MIGRTVSCRVRSWWNLWMWQGVNETLMLGVDEAIES